MEDFPFHVVPKSDEDRGSAEVAEKVLKHAWEHDLAFRDRYALEVARTRGEILDRIFYGY